MFAKDFIWTTLKVIISVFWVNLSKKKLHPQIPDFLIVVSQSNIVLANHET